MDWRTPVPPIHDVMLVHTGSCFSFKTVKEVFHVMINLHLNKVIRELEETRPHISSARPGLSMNE